MEIENNICSVSPALVTRRHWRVLVLCFAAGFQPLLLEPMLRFHHSLRKVALREEEYVLMQAMSLFSPGNRKPSPLRPTLLLMIHPLCKYSNPAKLQARLNKHFFSGSHGFGWVHVVFIFFSQIAKGCKGTAPSTGFTKTWRWLWRRL